VTAKQRIPLPALLALVIAGALALGAAGWFLVLAPQRAKAADVQAEIDSINQQIQLLHGKALESNDVEPVRAADLFRLSEAMPDRADMAGVLLELNQVAADSGITFDSITPQTAVPISGYQAIPITLTFDGTFYNLADFLYRLRNLVDVENGRLSATGRLFAIDTLDFAESESGFPSIGATLVVDAFVYGTGAPATATPTTTTTTTTDTTATPPTSAALAVPSS
jgi:hypothetical protein